MKREHPRRWRNHLPLLAALVGLTLYVGWARAQGHVGFPLDDAWIHQTYARNLVAFGQWAFVPDQPSAGSTAPLWTLLLAAAYVPGIPFHAWTYALGGLCLVGTVLLAARLARRLWRNPNAEPSDPVRQTPMARFPSGPGWDVALVTGLAVALEWHLVWAAASGMETLLFALLALALWDRVTADPTRAPLLTGLLGGALILTRPEGVLAVGLSVVGAVVAEGVERRWRRGLVAGSMTALGSALVVTPYLALNLNLSGTLWPNTFYAKQAEYAAHLAQPLLARLWRMATLPLIGGQVLLVPGWVWAMWRAARQPGASPRGRRVTWWLPPIWVAATVTVYALRLPVTYQHGRYLIPIIPVLLVYGAGGTLALGSRTPKPLTQGKARSGIWRLGSRVWALSAAVLFLAFWFLGARAYATDVAIIEEEMVITAQWLNTHTEPGALVAVHDIGAVGYFAERPLLDLAGLVNPEVVPFIRDEERLREWLQDRGANYLVTFPSWYPALTADPSLEEVYRTNTAVTVAHGGENMAVYALRWGGAP